MTPEPAPDGRPVVGPVSRFLFWLFTVASTMLAGSGTFGQVAAPLPGPSPIWRPVLAVAGLVLLLGATVWGWAMIVRGTPLRVVHTGGRPGTRTWSERRRLYRAVREGGELSDGDRAWFANQLAGMAPLRLVLVLFAGVTGTNLLSLSREAGPTLPYFAALNAVTVAILIGQTGFMVWGRWMRRPAEAVGAAPTRVDEPVSAPRATPG